MDFDVIVIGGGAAGLSAALVLARARRRVLVVDARGQRNAPAGAVHGYLAGEGLSPREFLAAGIAQVRGYGGTVRTGTVLSARRVTGGFEVALDGGDTVRARRLLLATGLVDELPPVPGVRERWGRDVFHCPYCHGWELRDRAVGVLGSSSSAADEALLLRQWTADLTLLVHVGEPPTGEQREQLSARGVQVVEGEVRSLVVRDDRLRGVRLAGGTEVRCEALAVTPVAAPRADLPARLGLEPAAEDGGAFLPADPNGRTSVDGIWAAGNVSDLAAQVVDAASSASRAAIDLNADLVREDVAAAVAARRRARRPAAEDRYGVGSLK